MKINLPGNVEFIINKIYENGYEAFIVGGCVRDYIIGIEPNDYDITTDAKPNEVINIFKNYKIVNNGIKHGTVGVIINDEVYEITTYRIESEYENSRRPKNVNFTKNILHDLKRRDFTINSIAYNDQHGIVDEFDGIDDINKKIVKTVGNPNERFNEDGLRIIRAIRFSAKLGFEIDKETLNGIYENFKIVKNISKERITEELNKIILSKHPEKLYLLYETEIFNCLGIYNDFNKEEYEELKKELSILSQCDENIEDRLLMLEYLIANKKIVHIDNSKYENIKYYKENIQFRNIVNTLKYPKHILNYCNDLIQYMFIDEKNIDKVKIKQILNKIGTENLRKVLKLKQIYYIKSKNDKFKNEYFTEKLLYIEKLINKINEIEKNKECYRIKDLEINGEIIKQLGYSGVEIGKKLNYALEEVIINPFINNKKDLINIIK